MRIQLCSLHFKKTTLQSETKVFRAVTNNKYTFQNPNPSEVTEGRFNKERQYCFYIASHMEAAILEIISHYQNCIPPIIYVKELILKKEINLVDSIRWSYNDRSDPKDDYSYEHIMINQHITCPKRSWSKWLYNSTQIIADYFRDNHNGLRYQTPIAHLLQDPKIYGHDPRNLLNYAIFKDPGECCRLFANSNNEREIKTSRYLDLYNKNIDDDILEQKIRCRNRNETVSGVCFGNPCHKPSLDIYCFYK